MVPHRTSSIARPDTATGRYRQLDGLRGVAALVVVFNHYMQVVPELLRQGVQLRQLATLQAWLSPWTWLRFTPVRLLFNGQAAVVLFFVLSGFVLALPSGSQSSYRSFVLKRVFRVYMPFAVTILVVALAWRLAPTGPAPAASRWANMLRVLPGQPTLMGTLAMTGEPDAVILDPVMWTLVHEMRVSLLLPLLFAAMRMLGTARPLLLCLAISVAASVGMTESVSGSWFATGHFLWLFALGGAMAFHRDRITRAMAALGTRRGWVIWLAWAGSLMVTPDRVWWDFVLGLSAAAAIVLLLPRGRAVAVLESTAPRWLGRVSYSLYLTHLPLLLIAITAGVALPYLPVVFVMTLVAAEATFRAVELPFHRIGRRLAG